MNYPAAPMSGIYASLRQATGYQSEVILTPQEAGNQTLVRLRRIETPCLFSSLSIIPVSQMNPSIIILEMPFPYESVPVDNAVARCSAQFLPRLSKRSVDVDSFTS